MDTSDTISTTNDNLSERNAFGIISVDTSKFVKLSCGLYLNSKRTVAYKAEDRSHMDSKQTKPTYIYLTDIYGADLTDTINRGIIEMKDVIDTLTFQMMGMFYFKDKNHVYDFNPMMDGGTIAINWDADVKTFRILESELFAKDIKNCFYRGNIIEDADLKSFSVLDTSYSWHIAFDKYNYYEGENKMSLKEIKDQNLNLIRLKK